MDETPFLCVFVVIQTSSQCHAEAFLAQEAARLGLDEGLRITADDVGTLADEPFGRARSDETLYDTHIYIYTYIYTYMYLFISLLVYVLVYFQSGVCVCR